MAAYVQHLRKIQNNEVFYGGPKPQAKPFTTDRDILDAEHKFLRDDIPEPVDALVKEHYESLIKDCVLVDLSRYKEKQVAMRWRTIEEVKVGKGDKVCANIACGRNEGLEAMEVVFGYVEDGKKKDVLVKCVLCEKCERKMRKARNTGEKRRRRNRHREEVDDDGKREQTDDDARKRRRRHEEEHGKRHRRHQDEDPKKRRQSSSKDMSKDSHSKDGTDGSGKSRPRGSREH